MVKQDSSFVRIIFSQLNMKCVIWILIAILAIPLLWEHVLKISSTKRCNDRSSNERETGIPSNVHFVLGQGDRKMVKHLFQLASPFGFINYLNFLAARRHLRPKNFYVHYHQEPDTFWWNQTKKDPEIAMTLVKSRLVTKIFGKPVDHHAHRGDVMRLEVVMRYGGIYLDVDVLTLRSFEPLLHLGDVVMAKQEDDPKKACNAVIIGKKNALFLKRWYDTFQSFDQTCWGCAAVFIPGELSLLYPNEVTVLPTRTFFSPGPAEARLFFESNDYDFSSNYASHLWNKMHNRLLKDLTPQTILSGNFTLARMLRHAIGIETLQKLKRFFADDRIQ